MNEPQSTASAPGHVPVPTHETSAEAFVGMVLDACRYALRYPNDPVPPSFGDELDGDTWVQAALAAEFLSAEGRYSASLTNLRKIWTDHLSTLPAGPEVKRGERLIRFLDDAPRQLVFELMTEARQAQRDRLPNALPEQEAIEIASEFLGESDTWLRAFSRYASLTEPRLVIIPTWQCELRCSYCYIPKQDGRRSTPRTIERALDLLLASQKPRLQAQFFGGEALLEWGLIQHAMVYGTAQAEKLGKRLSFILSSNGYTLDAEKLAWLKQYPVKLELSLDGDSDTQNRYRSTAERGADSYINGIAPRAKDIVASGIPYDVIMVVPPKVAHKMPENFFHIIDLGFERLQINFVLGLMWSEAQKKTFADGLFKIGKELRKRWANGEEVAMINLLSRPMPIRLNGEITADYDGTLYGGNAFLHETEHKEKFVIGHLDDLGSFDRYWLDSPPNDDLLVWSYPPDITENNLTMGHVMSSFIKWMRRDGVPGMR